MYNTKKIGQTAIDTFARSLFLSSGLLETDVDEGAGSVSEKNWTKLLFDDGFLFDIYLNELVEDGYGARPAKLVPEDGKIRFARGFVARMKEKMLEESETPCRMRQHSLRTAEILEECFERGAKHLSPFDIRLASLATALGALDGTRVAPPYLPALVLDFEESLSAGISAGAIDMNLAGDLFSRLCVNGFLSGCFPESFFFEQFRLRLQDPDERYLSPEYASAFSKNRNRIVGMAHTLAEAAKGERNGFLALPSLLSGKIEKPSFHLDESIFRNVHACERSRTFSFGREEDAIRPSALADFAFSLFDVGAMERDLFSEILAISASVSGRFDTAFGGRPLSSWAETRFAETEVSVPSVLEDGEFLDMLRKRSETSYFGEALETVLMLDCCDAFAPSRAGFDLSAPYPFSNRVASGHLVSWLHGALDRFLSRDDGFTARFSERLRIPCIEELFGTSPELFFSLVCRLNDERGPSFRDAVSVVRILSGPSGAKMLASDPDAGERALLFAAAGLFGTYEAESFSRPSFPASHPKFEEKYVFETAGRFLLDSTEILRRISPEKASAVAEVAARSCVEMERKLSEMYGEDELHSFVRHRDGKLTCSTLDPKERKIPCMRSILDGFESISGYAAGQGIS